MAKSKNNDILRYDGTKVIRGFVTSIIPLLILFVILHGNIINAQTGVITTVAGNGTIGFSGDGSLATEASLNSPSDVFVNDAGDLFIVDSGNDRIRKVDNATGNITTIAGGGIPIDGLGDGGLATEASLFNPNGISVNKSGNIFISETSAGRVRKVDSVTGIITTVAGGGDPVDSLGDGGPATEAVLFQPRGIFLDKAGNIFIAESGNKRIRKVDSATGIITTVAGGGNPVDMLGDGGLATEAEIFRPIAIFVDDSGNLFIADGFSRVRKVDSVTNIITTVAGSGDVSGFSGDGGLATEAKFSQPNGVFLNNAGDIFISDNDSNRIRKVDNATGIVTTIVGGGTPVDGLGDGGPAIEARLFGPEGLFIDSNDDLFIADMFNNRIRKVSFDEIVTLGPSIVSVTADDPDDGDSIYSDDDTITVLFSEPTNQPPVSTKNELDNLFIFSQNLGIDYIGTWIDPSTLIITIVNLLGATPPVVGELTITLKESGNLKNEAETSLISIATSPPLTGDFGTGDPLPSINPEPTTSPEPDATPILSPELTATPTPSSDTANIEISFDPDPLPDAPGLFGPTYTIFVQETNGIGVTIESFVSQFFNKDGEFLNEDIRDTEEFDTIFDECGSQPDGFIPGFDTACGSFTVVGSTPGEKIVYIFSGIDENGNIVEASNSVSIVSDIPTGKSFTFNCKRNFIHSRAGLERLILRLGENEQCTLRLTNLKPGIPVEISSRLRKGLRSAVKIEPARSITDANGELEVTITALHKGVDWAAWAVKNDKGRFEFNKRAYDAGFAWGMFVEVR